jgi:hypothetical protein
MVKAGTLAPLEVLLVGVELPSLGDAGHPPEPSELAERD